MCLPSETGSRRLFYLIFSLLVLRSSFVYLFNCLYAIEPNNMSFAARALSSILIIHFMNDAHAIGALTLFGLF